LLTASASAQVPESGRWQELTFSASEVDASMEELIDRTVDLAAAGKLDEDRACSPGCATSARS
jgi:hypothetical protein